MQMSFPRVANGFDVHRLEADPADPEACVILGGVPIACGLRLLGHSDADVVLHAITDALLGTIAAGDIGTHFPDTDSRWKNADSRQFVTHAHQLVGASGGQLWHLDVTVIAERPKLSAYREQIQQSLCTLLSLSAPSVSLKATTTERLGFTGRGEGIAALACATVGFAQRSVS